MTANSRKASRLVTLLALAVLAFLGFVAGVLGSILWEEPRLLIAYVMGDTTEIDWMGERAVLPGVASAPYVPAAVRPASPAAARPAPPAAAKPAPLAAARPAPPAAAKPAPPTAAEPPGPRLAIQVGSFGMRSSAEKLAAALRSRGYAAYVMPGVQGDRPRWRVRVGSYSQREAAETLAGELKRDEQLPTWIVEEESGRGR